MALQGKLDHSALTRASPTESSRAADGGGDSGEGGGGTGGAMSRLDATTLDLAALLRGKSYSTFTPAERTRLLRGLIDLAVSTGPVKEHMQARGCGVVGTGGLNENVVTIMTFELCADVILLLFLQMYIFFIGTPTC